jgi:TRAP-type C4-dicarboxylate transport system permease large subunit
LSPSLQKVFHSNLEKNHTESLMVFNLITFIIGIELLNCHNVFHLLYSTTTNCLIRYGITSVMKVETDIIANISVSSIGWAVINIVQTFKTNVIVIIDNIIICFCGHTDRWLSISESHWPMIVNISQSLDIDKYHYWNQKKNVYATDKKNSFQTFEYRLWNIALKIGLIIIIPNY